VSKLSQFFSDPRYGHWHALDRLMGYLKVIGSYSIHYTEYRRVLEGYSDTKYIFDAYEIKTMSEYLFTLGGGVVSWKSWKIPS
jgi:hypothetical protein